MPQVAMVESRYSTAIIALLLLAAGDCSAENSLELRNEDCFTNRTEPVHGTLSVSGTSTLIGQGCRIQFYTRDPRSTLILSFDDDNGQNMYDNDPEVTVSFYSVDGNVVKLIDRYTTFNWSSMWEDNVTQPGTSGLLMVITVGWRWYESPGWSLKFQLTAKPGPITDYPFSFAAGVFALSLTCTVALGLFIVCCWCCCCRKRETTEQVSSRRRRRMIDQLAKEGYSVSRDYGSLGSSTTLIRNDGTVVDIFSHPDVQLQPPHTRLQTPHTRLQTPHTRRTESNYEPPPAYESVGAQRRPEPQQYGRVDIVPTPVPQLQTVPEAVLVDIDGDPAAPPVTVPIATAPSVEDIPQDLIEFGTPPEQPSPIDLL